MCGIAGILKIHEPEDAPPPHPLEAIPEAWLDALDDSILHRGPDGEGRFRDRSVREDGRIVDVAFVHRRLSIIDHEGGAQPMVHDGERLRPDLVYRRGEPPILAHEAAPGLPLVAVVFNGCIYNHRELRTELEAQGHRFESDHSDTEVLVHGWREWSFDIFDRTECMLAAAVWDRERADSIVARDLFGEKPIYLQHAGSRTEFCSCVPGLASIGRSSLVLDAGALTEWIALGHDSVKTPIASIRQVGCGETIALASHERVQFGPASALRARSMRSAAAEFIGIDSGRGAAAEMIESGIDRAVGARLDADVPISCFLSGGLDSAFVARAAQGHIRERGGTLSTLCVKMPVDSMDESGVAAEVASILGTEHESIPASPNAAADMTELIRSLGLPFGDSSLLPTHWVNAAAAERSGVAIGGDGGDELFLGYERQHAAGDLVPLQAIAMATGGFSASLAPRRDPRSGWDKAARMLTASSRRSYRSLLAIFQHPDLRRLLGSDAAICRWNDRVNDVRAAQRHDLDHYLPGDLLRKTDTASMACPIELRNPLLDRALCACTLSMHTERLRHSRGLLVSHARRKALLRHVARTFLPPHLVDRPKQGFAIPIGEWFRNDFGGMRQLLHDHLDSADPFPGLAEAGVNINMGFVRRMQREHDAAGERSVNPWHGRDHSQRLYMLLVLSIWARWLSGLRGA